MLREWLGRLFGVEPIGSGRPRSPRWRSFSRGFLTVHPACAACGSRENVVAHHIVPFQVDPSRELDETNLIPLCENATNHHLTFGHLGNWSSWNPTVREDAAAYLAKVRARPMPNSGESNA